MILDKANIDVTAYPVVQVDDGYGATRPGMGSPITFKAFISPVGFSGAGWAIDSKLQSQGWAEVHRIRVITKPQAGLSPAQKWSRILVDGDEFTVVDAPRLIRGTKTRMSYVTMTCELKGDA